MRTARLGDMQVKRRPRGTRIAPVRAAWSIELHRKERFDQIARNSGVTSSVFLELVIDHLETELSDRGVAAVVRRAQGRPVPLRLPDASRSRREHERPSPGPLT